MSGTEIDSADFERDLDNYLRNLLPNGIEEGIKKACFTVEAEAKSEVNVDMGQLRASIRSETDKKGTEINGYVGTNVEYGLFYHEGTGIYAKGGNGRKTPWIYIDRNGKKVRTVGQKPKPFLENAVNKNKDKISKIIEQSLK